MLAFVDPYDDVSSCPLLKVWKDGLGGIGRKSIAVENGNMSEIYTELLQTLIYDTSVKD